MSNSSDTTAKDVAVPGLLRPPLVLLAAIALGVVLNLIWPLRFITSALVMAGPVIVLAAVLLFVLSLREFRAHGTSVRGTERTTRIVRTGPYRFSRNPIYLAFVLFRSRIGALVKQPVAARGSGSVRQLHLYHDHPAGGTIPRTQFPGSVF